MGGLNMYYGNKFVTEIARTSTQGNQFTPGGGGPVAIQYIDKWGWPDNQYPITKGFNETYRFGNYPAEVLNASAPSSYMSSKSVSLSTNPSRIFYWQYHNDVNNKCGSVGFIFPARANLAFDIINEKYI